MSISKIHKVVFGYATIGSIWVLGSDWIVEKFFHDISQRIVNLNSVKGLFFVVVTSVLFYLVLKVYGNLELKQSKLLQSSETRYRLLVENMMDGVLLTSPDGKIYFANKAAQELFGMTEDEVCRAGRSFLVDHSDIRLNILMKMREDSGSARGGLRFLRKSGSAFESEISSSMFRDDNGNLRTCMIIRDVTDTKIAEENLQKELTRRRIVMNISNDGIAIFNDEHRIIECNYKFAEMIGYTMDEAVGLYTWDFEAVLTEEQIRRSFLNFSEVYRTFESKHRRKNGSIYDVEVSASGVDIGSESIVVTISRDISERKRAEHNIKESEERFRNLFDHVDSISVQGYDSSRTVKYWNHASEVLYGYSRGEAVGKKLEDLIIPQTMKEGVVNAISSWICEGKAIPPGELCLKKKDGTDVFVFSSHVLQENRFGKKELFCLDIDLSELHKTKQELVKSKENAELANRTKSEFLANMSHEIRTPLNGVLGMLQLLQTTNVDDEQKEYILGAIRSSNRLTRLLSDILDLSRVESNKLCIQEAVFNVAELTRSVADVFLGSSKDQGLELSFVYDERIPSCLVGDEVRVRQVLFNLVGNAIKFTDKGSVTLESSLVSRGDDDFCRILFSVTDTGVGIPSEQLRSVFDAFTQVDGSYVRSRQGAGLGLAIVRRLVDLMDGRLCIDSELGLGTIVCVVLNFKRCIDVSGINEHPKYDRFDPCFKYKILVVEDENMNRLVASKTLEKLGYFVVTANNGKEGLEKFKENDFDVVFMDIQMPVMDGIQATKAIRDLSELGIKTKVPIIAMTAHAMSGDRETFLEAGMDDYVAKPFDKQALIDAISRVMAKQNPSGR